MRFSFDTGKIESRKGVRTQRIYYQRTLWIFHKDFFNFCHTKSKPLKYSEFPPLIQWWDNRISNKYAWKVNVKDIIKYDEDKRLLVNLDIKNPNKKDPLEHIPPKKLITEIIETERSINQIINEIKNLQKSRF